MNKRSASFLFMLSCVVLPLGTAHAAILVGYWPFEEQSGETVFDLSTFGNNGTLTGATRSEGKVGSGLSFDGSGGVTVPHNLSLDSLPGGFTFSAWIKPTSFPDFTTIFFKTDRNNLVDQLHFQVDGRLYMAMNGPTVESGFEGIGPNTVALDEWQYVAWTFDDNTVRFYDDGLEVFSAPYSQPWIGNDHDLQIGQHQQLPIANFRGLIDEPRIYRGALTQDEILRDMNGPVIPEPSPFLLLGSGLLGLAGWRRRQPC